MEEGRFRQDLFYRLNVIPLMVPPLRSRKEDIPLLMERFLADFALKEGEPKKILGEDALAILMEHSWPGNVRELKNFIERLAIMTPSIGISAHDIPPLPKEGHKVEPFKDPVQDSVSGSFREAKMDFEKSYLSRKLREFEGNISRTAESIGLERSNLHKKIKAYGLESKGE